MYYYSIILSHNLCLHLVTRSLRVVEKNISKLNQQSDTQIKFSFNSPAAPMAKPESGPLLMKATSKGTAPRPLPRPKSTNEPPKPQPEKPLPKKATLLLKSCWTSWTNVWNVDVHAREGIIMPRWSPSGHSLCWRRRLIWRPVEKQPPGNARPPTA